MASVAAVAMIGFCSGQTAGQTDLQAAGEVSRFDAYGNAQPWYPERRIVGSFSNDMQLEATRGFQLFDRRTNQRGAEAYFSLPGHVTTHAIPDPLGYSAARSSVSPTARKGFNYYGGYAPRRELNPADGPVPLFERRYLLIEATAGNAPVQRAIVHGGRFGVPGVASETVLSQSEREQAPKPDADLSLSHELRRGITDAHERTRASGWQLFQERQYRSAARAFESAGELDAKDSEARIGEIFSYASIGSLRTAAVLVEQFQRRDPGLLAYDIDMRKFYERDAELRQVRLQTGLFARAARGKPEATALHAFVLWYSGSREEAQGVAENLGREHADSSFARWALQMKDAAPANEGD